MRVTVIGGGHGVAVVLEALRDEGLDLAAVVTVADDGGSSGELRRRWGGAAVGDLRRALIALSDDEHAAYLADRVPCGRLGRHAVGNLVIRGLASTLGGDLQAAIDWLGAELRVRGRVIPATVGEVSLVGIAGEELIFGESAIGSAAAPIDRLRFSPPRPAVSAAAVQAIQQADLVLLGPGSLFTSVLAVAALPDLRAALAATPAEIVWICNLVGQAGETGSMPGAAHLDALRREGVRVDGVLHDPSAAVHLAPADVARAGVVAVARRLSAARTPGAHDPRRLRGALRDIIRERRNLRSLSVADTLIA